MPLAVESTMSRVPLPSHFSYADQSFSLKKRRHFSSSSTSNSSGSSLDGSSTLMPPLPPSKGCPPVSRLFPQRPSPWTPLSGSLCKSPLAHSEFDPSKQQSYFSQCFTNLGLLGRGCFGEVFKVESNKDGRQYAIKRSSHRFRGNSERNRRVKEARNHERICPHPHILNFVAAWEEYGRLYIQTELCRTSLLLHAEKQPRGTDERAAWGYLCDLLSALEHLHSNGFIHLDLKPANVLITDSGRLKLADFGLLLEFNKKADLVQDIVKDDVQEGDPRYMAPELLRGEYGPAADIFSLGISILELACNIEVPNGGESWQRLRQGCLPAELTGGLSAELRTVLQMMLSPQPSERPTVSELLALPAVKKRRWKRRVYLLFAESLLTLASLCKSVVRFGCGILSYFNISLLPRWTKPLPCTPPKGSWDKDLTLPLSAMHADSGGPEDDTVFLLDSLHSKISPSFSHRVKSKGSVKSTSTPLPGSQTHDHQSPAGIPSYSHLWNGSPGHFPHTPSSIHAKDFHTPGCSPGRAEIRASVLEDAGSPSRNGLRAEVTLPRPMFEPKNLLGLFEETALEGQP